MVRISSKKIIAFCHIEKAAGTSLTHILRRIFFLRYAAVRPMHSKHSLTFSTKDLDTITKVNPFLLGIGGHSIVPYGDLMRRSEQLSFITQVREPISRAVSQYFFWNSRNIDKSGPQSFLEHQVSRNFQVKKLAGCEDLDRAKDILLNHFLLAGTVDNFDEFLVLLADRLSMPLQLFTYRKRNVDIRANRMNVPKGFYEGLRQRNQLDQQLYDWIKTDLFQKHLAEYRGDFPAALARFRRLQASATDTRTRLAIDFVYRNAYLKFVSGLIRMSNGLPFSGSYATE